jgi:hypothetical protein
MPNLIPFLRQMTTNLIALSSDDGEPDKGFHDRNTLNLIRDSLEQKITGKRKLKDKESQGAALVSTIEEFMRNFTLIGFDLNDEPLIISRASTYLDGEALMSLSKKVLHDITSRTHP